MSENIIISKRQRCVPFWEKKSGSIEIILFYTRKSFPSAN